MTAKKTLNEAGKEALVDYEGHREVARDWQKSKFDLDTLNIDRKGWENNKKRVMDRWGADSVEEARTLVQQDMAASQEEIDRRAAYGAKFAKDNAEQLHELAAIEAHMGGRCSAA